MGKGEKWFAWIFLAAMTVAFLFLIGSCIVAENEEATIGQACWKCGWGKTARINGEYVCAGRLDGADIARPLEWVQENACQGND